MATALTVILAVWGCGPATEPTEATEPAGPLVRAKDGVLDLRSWNPGADAPVELVGEWGFYWQELRGPNCGLDHHSVLDLPAVWNGLEFEGQTVGGEGYATFCLRVELGEAPDRSLAVRVPRVRTASAVWINGTLLARTGSVGTDAMTSQPVRVDQLVAVAPAQTLDIVLHVSNFHFRSGGPDKPFVLSGSLRALEPMPNSVESAAAAFFTGGFLILGLYHLLLRTSRERALASRIFGVLCVVMAGYQLTRANNLFVHLFSLSWPTEIRLEYSLFAACVPLGAVFLRTLFPNEVSALLVRAASVTSAVFVASVWVLPTTFSSRWSLGAFQVVFLLLGSWGIASVFLAVRRRRPGSRWILAAAALWVFTGMGDGLVSRLTPGAPKLLAYGFMGVIIAQAVVLSIAHSQQNRRTKELSTRLLQLASEGLSLERAAYQDPLTGLENRRRLDESGAQVLERLADEGDDRLVKDRTSLLYLDIDRFKSINDQFGHDVGDEVLVRVADAIREQVRPSDLTVRLGGDEFVILAPGTDADGAEEVATRLRSRLVDPLEVSGHQLRVSLSIGMASSTVADFDLGSLMRRADRSMYADKVRGRGPVAVHA